jgi:hypothetical protein
MESLAPMTNSGESRPILFGPTGDAVVHASEPLRQTGIWGQVRPHLEFATKLLPMTWSVFLFLRGLNRTTQHWYTQMAAASPWRSLSGNQSVPILYVI